MAKVQNLKAPRPPHKVWQCSDALEYRAKYSSDSRHLIEVKSTALKGLGVFAKADILRGTRVIAESALLRFDGIATDATEIVRVFETLFLPEQSSYLELHGYACDLYKHAVEQATGQSWHILPELHRKVLAIYAANSFDRVFLLGPRINHSCIPNIDFAYNRTLEKETFHAVRDITAGEELTISYITGVNRTRIQRQSELDNWGFRCLCPACEDTAPGRRREEERAKLFSLDQDIAIRLRFGLGTDATWRKALNSMQNLAAIQKSEGLLSRALSVT
jgi:hypothetical protein